MDNLKVFVPKIKLRAIHIELLIISVILTIAIIIVINYHKNNNDKNN